MNKFHLTHGILIPLLLLTVCPLSAPAQSLQQQAQTKMTALRDLIQQAQTQNLPVLKEQTTLRTAEIFLTFADWDQNHTDLNQTFYESMANFRPDAPQLAQQLPDFERHSVIDILDRAIEQVSLLLQGKIKRRPYPAIDFAQLTVNPDTITQFGRPVFLLDHVWKPRDPDLNEYFGAFDGDYIAPSYVNENGSIKSWVLNDIRSKPSGRLGWIFLSHNSIPSWAYDKYDNFKVGSRHYGSYDIDHPGARELFANLFKGLVPLFAHKNYSKLGYMLFNEPSFFTRANTWNTGEVSSYTMAKFKTFLRQRHHDIAALNALWNTQYQSFDDVQITIPIDPALQGTPIWYDWITFNNARVTDWFRFLIDEIHKYDPDARCHIKLMPWLWSDSARDHGMDFEALTRLCNISGSDAQIYKSITWGKPEPWMDRYAFQWRKMSLTYDFFKSVRPHQLILDSETHFLSSVRFREVDLDPQYARAAYSLAFMHGLNISQSWVWSRDSSGAVSESRGAGHVGSTLQQPAVLNEVHATLIDLNSCAPEITAIQQQRKPLRIFYSLANAINRKSYMDDLFALYESLYFEGLPLGFATARIIDESAPDDWDAILIRRTETVTPQDLNSLQACLDRGGTVILDSLSLKTDQYGRPLSPLRQSAGSLIIADTLPDFKNSALTLLERLNHLPAVKLTETNAVGAPGCVWRCVRNADRDQVISIVNTGKSTASLTLQIPNRPQLAIFNLLTGQPVPASFTLPPNGTLIAVIKTAGRRSDLQTMSLFWLNPICRNGFCRSLDWFLDGSINLNDFLTLSRSWSLGEQS